MQRRKDLAGTGTHCPNRPEGALKVTSECATLAGQSPLPKSAAVARTKPSALPDSKNSGRFVIDTALFGIHRELRLA